VKNSKDDSSHGMCVAFLASHVRIPSLSHDDEDTCACETLKDDSFSVSSECESECASEGDSEL